MRGSYIFNERRNMKIPTQYFYVNVSQTIGIIGAIYVVCKYIDYEAQASGLQKRTLRQRIFGGKG